MAPWLNKGMISGIFRSTTTLINEGQGMRFQQVFMSSEFGGTAGYIQTLYFRADASDLTQAARVESLQINLSTTLATASSLSPVFAANIGADEQVFWGPTGANLVTSLGGWDIAFYSETPLYYDPARGNLLMEIKNFSGSRPGDSLVLDAHTIGNSLRSLVAHGAESATGSHDLAAYAVLIEWVPVPEASIWKLGLVGAAILLIANRKKIHHELN